METLLRHASRSDLYVRIELNGNELTAYRGSLDTPETVRRSRFPDPAAAQAAYERLIGEVTNRGYVPEGLSHASGTGDSPQDSPLTDFFAELWEQEAPAPTGHSPVAVRPRRSERKRGLEKSAQRDPLRNRKSPEASEKSWSGALILFTGVGFVLFGSLYVLSTLQVTGPPQYLGTWQSSAVDWETSAGVGVKSRRFYQLEENGVAYYTTDNLGILLEGKYTISGDQIRIHVVGELEPGRPIEFDWTYRFEASAISLSLTNAKGQDLSLTRAKGLDLRKDAASARR